MTRHLLWFVLVLSLLFNVFFAAGYVKTSQELASSGSGPDAVAVDATTRRVARELNLDDEQKEVFSRLLDSLGEDQGALRESFARTEQELRQTLDAPAFDVVRFQELMTRRADLHRQRMLMASDRFGEFVAVLTPEQCRDLARRIARDGPRGGRGHGHGRGRGGHWRAMLERFDADGDGQLNDSERAAAEAHMAERRREWWGELLERFDANGNGELDPEEREAMRQSRLRHRGTFEKD